MSLIPFILDLADELHEFSRCLANGIDINDFGFGLYTGSDQQQPQHQQQQSSPRRSRTSSFSSLWMPSKRHHPYNRIKTACCGKSGEETVVNQEKPDAATPTSSSIGGTPGKSASYSVVNKNGFQVSMNVKQFAPNELSVKTIDNCIVVEGRHDDKEDGHGVISRHFVRKYMLPKGYDPNDVLSTLSSDGILTVKAPPPPPPAAKNDDSNERVIDIQPTPGPTPAAVVSAKETPAKETAKKVATQSVRLECQLPEKRQKLDLPLEPESKETSNIAIPTTTPPQPLPSVTNNISETSTAAASKIVKADNTQDVEMEKCDVEQTTEIFVQQSEPQKSNVTLTGDSDEKNTDILDAVEQEKIIEETKQKPLEADTKSETNGEMKNSCENSGESCNNVTDAAITAEKVCEIPAETAIKNDAGIDKASVTKMEVDNEDNLNANDDNMKNDNINAATEKADIEKKVPEKTSNIDISSSNNSNTTISNNNISTNTVTNNITTTTTSNSDTKTDTTITVGDGNDGNNIVTGKIPVDIPKPSTHNDADTAVVDAVDDAVAATATTKTQAESAIDGEADLKTAVVLNTDTTTTNIIIDEVALLKAATADPAIITDKEDGENNLLAEAIDGITTTDSAAADSVECSLFAKKTLLGNGNSATTTLLGTEEMAN